MQEHGVAADAVTDRVAAAVSKLGAGAIAAALSAKNQWQALKAAGSKPSTRFMWVQHDELQAHIAKRAEHKFGAGIAHPKTKKQQSGNRSAFRAPLHVEPAQLQLGQGSFVSEAGQGLCQLAFEEVVAQASGVCFVTAQQATPFLEDGSSLSVDALALLTTAELAPEACGRARVSSLRYPAVFTPTQEAVLVAGSMIQLGDETVQLALNSVDELEQVETCVCRLNLYKDEIAFAWDRVLEAPLRALTQAVPAFVLCRDPACKGDCARFHPAVEEQVEHLILEVWARQYLRVDGSRARPAESELFQAYIRLPSSAIHHLFKQHMPGVCLEPRSAEGTGPHPAWTVVWLPGAPANGTACFAHY